VVRHRALAQCPVPIRDSHAHPACSIGMCGVASGGAMS
jgi:hypothetical protein